MSEQRLPADRSAWPTNPYRLLGVAPGASGRDVRRAYLALIRIYKPEHSPDEFRRIREAYEALKDGTQPPPPADREAGPAVRLDGPKLAADPWNLALGGDLAGAYRDLAGAASGGSGGERAYLQLYWLLVADPGLDPGRSSVAWIVRGLLDRGPNARQLVAFLAREADLAPASALGDSLAACFEADAAPGLLGVVAAIRWRAARTLGRWEVIVGDLDRLRAWLPGVDEDAWAGHLVDATTQLAWGLGSTPKRPDPSGAPPPWNSDRYRGLRAEADRLTRHRLDLADPIARMESAGQASSALVRIRHDDRSAQGLHDLLRAVWDRPPPGSRSRFLPHLIDVAADPIAWLRKLDALGRESPAALQVLVELPDQLGFDRPMFPSRDDRADIEAAALAFLAPLRWGDYARLRTPLLRFCLAENIAAGRFADAARARAGLVIRDGRHLADAVLADWPLAIVTRYCEIVNNYR